MKNEKDALAIYQWQNMQFNGAPFLWRPVAKPVDPRLTSFMWLPLGATFPAHSHPEEEIVRVVKGKIAVGTRTLTEGTGMRIPAHMVIEAYSLADSLLLIRRPREIVYRSASERP